MSKHKRRSAMHSRGYSEAGASSTKRALKGFVPNSGSPSEDINANNFTLRQRSRMLYMASPIATSAINVNRTKVIGTGLIPKATPNIDILKISPEKAQEWQKTVESEFNMWASKAANCDTLGLNNFYSLQQLALKSWLLSGDCFALITRDRVSRMNPYSLRLHLIEADRIATPDTASSYPGVSYTDGKLDNGHKCYDGVEVDESGKVLAYHIRNTYPYENYSMTSKVTWTRIPAVGARTGLPNILHIMDAERPDQYRGIPYLAQVIEPLLQIRRYTESELMSALIQSLFTAWITTETDPTDIPFNEVGGGDAIGEPGEPEVSHSDDEYEMGPGQIVHLKEGENITFGNPNIPTSGFDAFVKVMCREVGSALEIPYEILLKEFNSSYSASRAALLEAWEAFRMRRTWFVNTFCQPVYELWLSEAIARGRIKAPGFWDDPLIRDAWCKVDWIGPIPEQLDPNKEATANISLIAQGIKTRAQVTREMGGGDWDRNVERLLMENEKLAEAQKAFQTDPVETEPNPEPEEDPKQDNEEET